ncbi:MAG: tRNA lysidine(34) synthetase TilS [Legionellales bacterium RIFCSPHIGHO2_12_FULL_37_14]|nr:MAG: tRNA lysidine(34) synthetase TilS [Legionellales bacterium RIFCSPHIGHO2_12_FULL_37_14]
MSHEAFLSDSCFKHLLKKARLFVGLSGGLDSCVLLHLLANNPLLKPKIIAIHVHHGLSKNADLWESFCQEYCSSLNVPIIKEKIKLAKASNIEANARFERYAAFKKHLGPEDLLLLGHHEQDQAETFLLNLLRGSGVDGLGAMVLEREVYGISIYRPFLKISKQVLQQYAKKHKLKYIEDESNYCEAFARNYIRHKVLPALQHKWQNAVELLVLATYAMQRAQDNLFDLACLDYPELLNNPVEIDLSKLNLKRPRLENVIWYWLKQHKVTPLNANILERVVKLIFSVNKAYPKVILQQHAITKYKNKLFLNSLNELASPFTLPWPHFPSPLTLPNDLGSLTVTKVTGGALIPNNAKIEVKFNVKNAQLFWHKQTKTLKKLWQEWAIPKWQRSQIPLVYVNNELAIVVGQAISDNFHTKKVGFALAQQIMWDETNEKLKC